MFFNGLDKMINIKWLGDVFGRPQFDRFFLALGIFFGADDNDRGFVEARVSSQELANIVA
jgi:hypothetical protein